MKLESEALKMISVLLVDDEPNVRQGVKMMIPWDELELEVIGEGEDGDDGFAKIMSLKPDIVVADVKMPGMTGIQMIEAAVKHGYTGKCLILSGYSDFTYAKEAMFLGVKQFILKPVDEDELIKGLRSVRDEILEERRGKIAMEQVSEYMNEQLTRALLLGDESIISQNDLSSYDHRSYDVAVISCTDEMRAEERNAFHDTVKNRFEGGGTDIITAGLSGVTVILFKGWERKRIIEMLTKFSREYSGRIFITVGSTVRSPDKIKDSYQEADSLLGNRFHYLHYGVLTKDTIIQEETNTAETEEIIGQIYAYVEINDTEKLDASLEKLRISLCGKNHTAEKSKVICITTVMEIKSRLIKSIGDKKTEQFINDEFITKIGEQTSLFDIIEMLKRTLTDLSNTHFGRTTKSTMERVVQYIQSNYSSELRLELLANIFGYNSAYLGKVFHQYTGENFNNYLDSIRISEAKRLLAMDEYKVYEVAEMVGYTNINYFHNKFKKYVGISPRNYKRQCRGGTADTADEEEEE